MKKYRVIVPGINKEFKFTVPKVGTQKESGNKRNTKSKKNDSNTIEGNTLYSLLNYIELKAFYLLLTVIPFSYLFINNDLTDEGSIFIVTLLLLIVFLAIYISRSLLIGFKNLKEPKGLIPILTFGLLLSVIALINDPATAANTFGTDTVKGISSLAVVAFILLFYFTSIFLTNGKHVKKAFLIVVLGFTLGMVVELLDENIGGTSYLTGIFILPILWVLLQTKSYWHYLFIGIFILTISNFIQGASENLPGGGDDFLIFIILTITALIALFINIIKVLTVEGFLKRTISNLKTTALELASFRDKDKRSILDNLISFQISIFRMLFLLFPIIAFGILIAMYSKNMEITEILNLPASQLELTFEDLERQDNNQSILFGDGSDNILGGVSLTASTLLSSGVLGLSLYILLWIMGIYVALMKFISFNRSRNTELSLLFQSLLFTLLFIPAFSFFIYPGLIPLIIWWIALGITLNINDREVKVSEIKYRQLNLNFKGKNLTPGIYIFLLFLVVITLILIYSLFEAKNTLI